MMPEIRHPASFLLRNSKGHPDFVMTMLVAVTLAMFIVVLFWLLLNIMAFRYSLVGADGQHALLQVLQSFNENARLIVLGFASSVFSLAGAYYLRRASHDKHFAEREKIKLDHGVPIGADGDTTGFVSTGRSTLLHPNYDDGEEDI
jgi:hypothetical protein